MANSPTIVAASLDSKELETSISKLVQTVNQQTDAMAKHFTDKVSEMQQALQTLGSTKYQNSASSGDTQLLSSQKALETQAKNTTQALKEQNLTLDQMASAKNTAIGKSDVLGQYDEQLNKLKERLADVRQDIDIFNYAIGSGKATQVSWGQEGLQKAKEEAEQLMQVIATLEKQRGNLANVIAPQGDTIRNYVNSLTQANPELQKLNEQFKTGQALMQNGVRITNEQAQSNNQSQLSYDHLAQAIQRQNERQREFITAGQTAQETYKSIVSTMKEQLDLNVEQPIQGLHNLKEQIEIMRRAYWSMDEQGRQSAIGMSLQKDIQNAQQAAHAVELYNRALNGIETGKGTVELDKSIGSYNRLSVLLKDLTAQYHELGREERNSSRGDDLAQRIQNISHALQQVKKQEMRPINLESILGYKPQTLDDIAWKMQQLQSYRQGIDLTKEGAAQKIKDVDNAMVKLQSDMDKYAVKGKEIEGLNNALGRSWNYMKNRLAFYFTVGASTQFVKNLIEIRSQYEMNERALGILVDSAERGTQIFKELSEMALVSPYTLIELSNAARQLTAYDIAAKDVVDTTRRLADMASAVGIPLERITYALGHIKSYGYLNSRDARMFANAGIPLVKQLADYYSELEGKMVSVSDVYSRMKNKAIDFNDVMRVVNKMTDEGGKFFDFQAKMAETLKVQVANLTLAWNNMLNDIGKSNQELLSTGIKGLKELFLRWKEIDNALTNLIKTFTVLKVAHLSYYAVVRNTNKAIALETVVGQKLANVLRTVAGAFRTLVASPWTWATLGVAAIGSLVWALRDGNTAMKEFNKTLRDGAKDNYDNISQFLEQYRELQDSLYKTREVYDQKSGITTKERVGVADIDKGEAKKAWEAVREEIELTSQSSDEYIGKLLTIENISERLRQAFNILDDVKAVNAAFKEIGDDGIEIARDWSDWYNLWLAPDGLVTNLKEHKEVVDEIVKEYGSVAAVFDDSITPATQNLVKALDEAGKKGHLKTDFNETLAQMRRDIEVTTKSINDFINAQGWSFDQGKIDQVYKQFTEKFILENQLDPETAYRLQLEMEEARSSASKRVQKAMLDDTYRAYLIELDKEHKAALANDYIRLRDEYNEWDKYNGRTKVEWERFTKWIREQHISETTAMFRDMDTEQIRSLNFQEGKYYDWVNKLVKQYAKSHKMTYDESFRYLRDWVTNANKWSIFIPLIIGSDTDQTVFEVLSKADKDADEAWSKIERLSKRRDELISKGANKVGADKDESKEYGSVLEEIAQAQQDYNNALAKGGHSKKEDKKNTQAQKQAESELQKMLKEELQLIDKIRSAYKDLTKEGATHAEAIEKSTDGFDESVRNINRTLAKFGIAGLDLKKFAGVSNPRELVNLLQIQLDALIRSGSAKPSEIQDLQVKIRDLKLDAEKYDLTKITKGLNSELDKLKDEYELAVELDANPELGNMFAEMFGIDTNALPQTFGEALDRANDIVRKKLKELKVSVSEFDLLDAAIIGDENNRWNGLDMNSTEIQEILKWQNTLRDMFKKNITETEKTLDDFVKKYGDYSDKIAEIESDRLTKIKKLNEAYFTEEMRRMPEYITKLNAIEEGAVRQKQSVDFEDFKDSRYYTMMFENLDYISTKTIRDMRDRIRELIDTMNDLTPEQLKTLMTQYEKLEQKMVKRSPFKTLTKDLKQYLTTAKDRKSANETFRTVQKQYDAQKRVVASLKEQYEQVKRNVNKNENQLEFLQAELGYESDILEILRQQLDAAQKKADKYNLIKKLALEEAQQTAQVIATNLQSLEELRDQINDIFGKDTDAGESVFGSRIDGMIDGLTKVGEGLSKITSSATSGNVVGVVSGVVSTVVGIGDSIASIFGGGAAKTRRLNREINKSKETVRQLQMAYVDLERAVNAAMGSAETEARREQIANKEAELAEIERQKTLEESKRSKDRDSGVIKQYEESIQTLRNEIRDLKDEVVNNLLGGDVKSAAESFVDTWVQAWKAGETTLDAVSDKMDEVIEHLIKKSMANKIVGNLLQPFYSLVDDMTKEESEGGQALTLDELRILAQKAGLLSEDINEALGEFYGNLANLGIISKTDDSSQELSALQQGIQGITETTAGALEGMLNGMSQQVYLQSDLLTQIRDTVVNIDFDVQTATQAQMLLQLQQSYTVQMAIQTILAGTLNPSGRAFTVELAS